jgi:hypothetical protein
MSSPQTDVDSDLSGGADEGEYAKKRESNRALPHKRDFCQPGFVSSTRLCSIRSRFRVTQ